MADVIPAPLKPKTHVSPYQVSSPRKVSNKRGPPNKNAEMKCSPERRSGTSGHSSVQRARSRPRNNTGSPGTWCRSRRSSQPRRTDTPRCSSGGRRRQTAARSGGTSPRRTSALPSVASAAGKTPPPSRLLYYIGPRKNASFFHRSTRTIHRTLWRRSPRSPLCTRPRSLSSRCATH